jgi:hypothetical protein
MTDPQFLADAKKQHIEIKKYPATGRIFNASYAVPPEVVKAANEAMNLAGGVMSAE